MSHSSRNLRPLFAAALVAVFGWVGCQPSGPASQDTGPTYSPQGLAREVTFQLRAVANGVPGASSVGGAPSRDPGGQGSPDAKAAAEEGIFVEAIRKLRTIKDTPVDRACETLIEELGKTPELTDEQKSRATERLRTLANEPVKP